MILSGNKKLFPDSCFHDEKTMRSQQPSARGTYCGPRFS